LVAEAALDRVRDKYGPGIVTPLRHVFAAPDDVADVADGLVRRWHTPVGSTARSGTRRCGHG
jgi:hypothetical protein